MDGSGGGRGSDLRGKLQYGSKPKEVAEVIRNGIPGMMPGSRLAGRDIRKLAAYVLHLSRKGQAEAKGKKR